MSKFEVIMPNVIAEQPTAGATESFEWLTNVIESRDGREHRVMLRSLPRVTLDYSFIAHPHNRNYYLNLLRNNLTDIWLLPSWLKAVYVGRINKGTTIVENHFDNHVGDNLLIYQDITKKEVATWLKSSEKKSLEFVFHDEHQPKLEFVFKEPPDGKLGLSPAINDYQAAYLLPLEKCYLNNVTYKTSGFDAKFDITAELVDQPLYRAELIQKQTYLGIEVLHNNYGANESTLNKCIDKVDYDIGKTTRINKWDRTKSSRSILFYMDGLDEIKKFKQFVYRMSGRLNPFWLCDGDVNIYGSKIVGNQIIIRNDLPSFNYLALFHDNCVTYVKIMSVSHDNYGNTIIVFDKHINYTVNKISYLMLCRFDSDIVQIKYDTNQRAQSNIQVTEVFDDQYFQTV